MRVIALIARNSAAVGFRLRQYLGFDDMKRPFARLLPYVVRYRRIYAMLALLLFVDIGLTLFFTWFMSQSADAALSGEIGRIAWLMLLGVIIIVLSFVANFYEAVLESETVNRIKRDLKMTVFGHMLRLPARFFSSHHSGDLVSRLTLDVNGVEGALGSNLLNLIRMPFLAAAAFAYLLIIHWQLALMCTLIGPAALLIAGIFGKLMRDNGKRLQRQFGKVNAFLHDVFSGFAVMRVFAMERKLYDSYEAASNEVLKLERREARLLGWLTAGSSTLSLAAFFIALGFGAYLVAIDSISIGSLFAFVSLVQYIIYPFSGIARQWGGLQRSLASAERIWNVLDTVPDRSKMPEYLAPSPLADGIRIEGVTFAYEEDANNALNGIDLYIPAGRTVALVGPNGSGKSTLFQLLTGLQRPTAGSICFDGRQLAYTDPDIWRSYISFVPQEPYLFAGTIRDNIAGGRPDATDEEIEQAARDANAHEFIAALPDGYNTVLGERGGDLSGGQRQRITIARAILKNAPILLLDEATSALDPESESLVQEALLRLMKDRTVLMITHRLSAMSEVDHILVMNQGKIVEQGAHEDLLNRNGLYARLYERR